MSDDTDWAEYESGPYCRHWGDPFDCDIACATCHHPCNKHWWNDECRECECLEWKEPD